MYLRLGLARVLVIFLLTSEASTKYVVVDQEDQSENNGLINVADNFFPWNRYIDWMYVYDDIFIIYNIEKSIQTTDF